MLIITRKTGDSIIIDLGDEQIEVTVTETGKQVRLGIVAPEKCKIWRKELYQTIQENKKAINETKPNNIKTLLRKLTPPSK